MKCTQKNPERRYHDCASLIQDLKRSLVDPDGEFVTLGAVPGDSDRTVVMSTEEIRQLQGQDYDEDEDDEDYDSDYDEDDDDDDEDDREYGGRRRKKKDVNPDTKKIMRILMIVAGVVIALLILFLVGNAVGLFSGPGLATSNEEDTVRVPDLRGMTEDEAREELSKYELGMDVAGEEPSNEYEAGEIKSHTPGPDETVERHTTIEVILSTGEEAETVAVPNVVNEEESRAEQMLRDAGLKVTKGEAQYSSDVEEGYVISCNPDVGTEVDEGSSVEIIVSLGTQPATVPKLTEGTAAEAEAALSEAGLTGSATEEYSDDVAEGIVISQSIDPGTEVSRGTTVSYVVSRGPETKIVNVPDIYGMDEATASQTLSRNGLVGEYAGESFSDEYGAGQICRISPTVGTRVSEGTVVQYWISVGPENTGESDTPDSGTDTGGNTGS